MGAESRLKELRLELPPAPKPAGVYKPVVISGTHVYVSGHGPLKSDKTMMTGRVGADVDLEGGIAAARQTGLAILSSLEKYIGNLNHIVRVVKLFGMVNCTPDFTQHPQVINGCSELFRDVWGPDRGVGARSRRRHGLAAGQHHHRDRSRVRDRPGTAGGRRFGGDGVGDGRGAMRC